MYKVGRETKVQVYIMHALRIAVGVLFSVMDTPHIFTRELLSEVAESILLTFRAANCY